MSKDKNTEKVKKPKSLAMKIAEWVITGIFGVFFIVIGAGTIDGMVHKNENYGESLKFGWAYFVVKTDSMDPKYPVDSAIVTHKDDVKDVYSYYIEHKQAISNESNDYYIDLTFMDAYGTGHYRPTNTKYNNDVSGSTRSVMTHRLREIAYNPSVAYGEGQYTFVVSGINIGGHQAQAGQYQVFTEKQYLGVVKTSSQFLGGLFNFISSVWGLLIMLLIPAIFLVVTSVLDIFKTMKEPDDEEKIVLKGDSDKADDRLSSISDKDRERLKRELLEQMIKEKQEAKAKEIAEAKTQEANETKKEDK